MKPTDNELEMAIVAAKEIRNNGRDEHHLAATLLYLYQRQQDLERVRQAAEDYLSAGRDEPRMTALVGAIEAARRNEQLAGGRTDDPGPA